MGRHVVTETSTIQGLLLGCLMQEKMSGYEISKYATKHLTHVYVIPSRSQIYNELKKFEEKGLVIAERINQNYRPDKSIYAITKVGKETFLTWLLQSIDKTTFKNSFLLKIYFSHNVNMDTIKTLVSKKIQEINYIMLRLGLRYAQLPIDTSEHRIERLIFRHEYMRLEAEYNWLCEFLDNLPCDEGKPRK